VWEAVACVLRARGERYLVVNPLTTFRVRDARAYLALRRDWGEYRRLREERARLKVLVVDQFYGLFPECLRVWADLLQMPAPTVSTSSRSTCNGRWRGLMCSQPT
jgi:hypothetical protein